MQFGKDPKTRLAILTAMVAELDKLLESKDLTRIVAVEVGGQSWHPAMTLGLVLETLLQLEGPEGGLAAEDRDALSAQRRRVEALRSFQPEVYRARLRREVKSISDSQRWASQEQGERDHQDRVEARDSQARLSVLMAELGRMGN